MFEIGKARRSISIVIATVLLLSLFGFKFSGSTNFIVTECLFVIYLVFILLILGSGLFKFLYEPPVYFLFGAFIYEALKFPYYFGFNTPEYFVSQNFLLNAKYKVSDYYAASGIMLVYNMACIIVLLSSYLITRRFTNNRNVEFIKFKFKKENTLLLVMAFAWAFSFAKLFQLTGGNILFLLSRRSGNADAWEILKSNYVVSLFANLILVLIPIYLSLRLMANKTWKWVLLLYVPAAFLSFLITGARGFTIFSIITSVVLVITIKKVPIRNLLPVAPLLIVFFAFLGIIRRSSDTTNGGTLSENIKTQQEQNSEWYLELSSYQLQLRDEMVFDNLKASNILFGETYLNILLFWVPREWIGDLKPQFLDAEVAQRFWGRDDIGLPLTSMGEAYFNFSYAGVLIFIIFGIVMGKITNYLHNQRKVLYCAVAIVLMVYAQTCTTSQLTYIFQFLIILFPFLSYIRVKENSKTKINGINERITRFR